MNNTFLVERLSGGAILCQNIAWPSKARHRMHCKLYWKQSWNEWICLQILLLPVLDHVHSFIHSFIHICAKYRPQLVSS